MVDFTHINRRQIRRDQIRRTARASARAALILANIAAAAGLASFLIGGAP
ncbi:hypothetical protein [Roseicitreum antarcticum]|uniref:Uncharacterized protein n=1 Tax=Roseicitreum antarcticum TaxID=564137 RepID=A0A1H2WBR6_9RHOB|nr:hypothetical protein [Roseicitreum antarcticum]SDW77479.1 hypothetical protein SAMN04488238_103317 [Roseicitreum antarcticum]